MSSTTVYRVRAEREIEADPTSTALLLAAPSAVEMWPGLRRIGTTGDGLLTEVLVGTGRTLVVVRAGPPRRAVAAYVLDVVFTGEAVGQADGTVRLEYAVGDDAGARTAAALRLGYRPASGPGPLLPDADEAAASLRAMADRFLRNLAEVAEDRSRAA